MRPRREPAPRGSVAAARAHGGRLRARVLARPHERRRAGDDRSGGRRVPAHRPSRPPAGLGLEPALAAGGEAGRDPGSPGERVPRRRLPRRARCVRAAGSRDRRRPRRLRAAGVREPRGDQPRRLVPCLSPTRVRVRGPRRARARAPHAGADRGNRVRGVDDVRPPERGGGRDRARRRRNRGRDLRSRRRAHPAGSLGGAGARRDGGDRRRARRPGRRDEGGRRRLRASRAVPLPLRPGGALGARRDPGLPGRRLSLRRRPQPPRNSSVDTHPLAFGEQPPIGMPRSDAQVAEMREVWLDEVTGDPLDYLDWRWDAFMAQIGIDSPGIFVYHPVIDPNDLGYSVAIPELNDVATGYQELFADDYLNGGTFHLAWFYLLLGLCSAIVLLAVRGVTRVVGALALSTLTYQVGLFFGTMGTQWRFEFPTAAITLICTAVAVKAFIDREPRRSAGAIVPSGGRRQRRRPSDRHELQPPRRARQVESKQRVERGHRGARRGARLALTVSDVGDQPLAAGDDRQIVQVEERKPGPVHPVHGEPGVGEHRAERLRREVPVVPDVVVEGRPGPARHRDHEPAARREQRPGIAQQGGRLVDVLEHLGADGRGGRRLVRRGARRPERSTWRNRAPVPRPGPGPDRGPPRRRCTRPPDSRSAWHCCRWIANSP